MLGLVVFILRRMLFLCVWVKVRVWRACGMVVEVAPHINYLKKGATFLAQAK